MSVRPDGKDENTDSRTEESRFDALQDELLLRARKRAEAALSNPPPRARVPADEYVPATPTRIGQPAFRDTDAEFADDEERREVERADTLPSFPPAVFPDSEQTETAAAEAAEVKSKSQDVVMRAEVVVVDVIQQAAKDERTGPDRRESRRVLLRDGTAVQALADEEEAKDSDDPIKPAESDFLQSEDIAYDEFAADGPKVTWTDDSESQQPSPAPDFPEVIPSTLETSDTAKTTVADSEPETRAHKPSRSKKGISAVITATVLISITAAGLFIAKSWERPSVDEQPKQTPGAQTANPLSTTAEVPMTQVTSSPEGAELVHQGAVIGNTPIKVKRPTYEQIFLLRFPGYESQLLRISPISGDTVHVTLQPSNNP